MISEPVPAASPPQDHTPGARGRALLEANIALVQKRLLYLSRHSGLPSHEGEDFCSWALYKLVEDEYRVLASWKERSSFSTYLTVVLANLLRDYRIRLWGKWRPSAAACRIGREAVLLEQLLVRDGVPLEHVGHRLRNEHGVSLPDEELERIAACLPKRVMKRRVGEESLRQVPVDGGVEARVEAAERALTAALLRRVLGGLLRSLPVGDLLLIKLHYRENLSIAAIAPRLGKSQREVYSLRDRCLKRLRQGLQQAGVGADQVRELIRQQASS